MTIETQKLELINFILNLNDPRWFSSLWQFVQQKTAVEKSSDSSPSSPRQFGFGKGTFSYVAPDFDETPPGFEEYMISDELPH